MFHSQQFASYPTFGAFPQTTYFAGAPIAQPAGGDRASQHEGSQAGEIQGASHSVSGFAGQPIDAGFGGFPAGAFYGGGFPAQGATFIGGAQYGAPAAFPAQYGATYIGAPTVAPLPLVPLAAPAVRRPGYNERLVAWRNRQKAFNRYKRATKEAIKNANATHYQQHNYLAAQGTVLAAPAFGAAPVFGQGYGAAPYGQTIISGAGYPYGATFIGGYPGFLPAGAVYAGEQHDQQQEGQYGDFTSYSTGNVAAQEVQQEEPEIRGTQV